MAMTLAAADNSRPGFVPPGNRNFLRQLALRTRAVGCATMSAVGTWAGNGREDELLLQHRSPWWPNCTIIAALVVSCRRRVRLPTAAIDRYRHIAHVTNVVRSSGVFGK